VAQVADPAPAVAVPDPTPVLVSDVVPVAGDQLTAIPVPATPGEAVAQAGQAFDYLTNGSYLLGGLLLIGVVVFFVMRSRKKKTPAP
jgi:hypothetical protein